MLVSKISPLGAKVSIVIRNATPKEISEVSRLLFAAYSERGYCTRGDSHGNGTIFSPKQRLHETVLVAEHQEERRIVGTMRVTLDEGDLPIDREFPEAMAKLRRTAHKLCYYGRFAVDQKFWGKRKVGLALIAEAVRRAKEDDIDHAVIIVNPRHIDFYTRMKFEVVDVSLCAPGLEKAPAVMMVLQVKHLFATDHPTLRHSSEELLAAI